MVQVRVDAKLIEVLRPYLETDWEKKCREDHLPTPSDAVITARAMQELYTIKVKKKDPYYS
jgi:hypothetical protein